MPTRLVGRRDECAVLDCLIDDVRACSPVYHAGYVADRRAMHLALVEVTDPTRTRTGRRGIERELRDALPANEAGGAMKRERVA